MHELRPATKFYKCFVHIFISSLAVGIVINKIRKTSETSRIRVLVSKFSRNAESLLFREVHYVLPGIRSRIVVMSYKILFHFTTCSACINLRYSSYQIRS